MDIEETIPKPILIYFQTRGNAQVVRSVLLHLQIDFEEVFVSKNGYLDPNIVTKYDLDLKKLPYLIHYQLAIFGIFPIIKYLCEVYNQKDLLGKNISDKLKIAEIMVQATRAHTVILHTIFKGLKQIYQKQTGQEGKKALARKIIQVTVCSPLNQHLKKLFYITKGFLFGYMTIIDFVLYERSFYGSKSIAYQEPQAKIAHEYSKFFQSTEFYLKNEKRLNSYKIFFHGEHKQINELMRQFWRGDPGVFLDQ